MFSYKYDIPGTGSIFLDSAGLNLTFNWSIKQYLGRTFSTILPREPRLILWFYPIKPIDLYLSRSPALKIYQLDLIIGNH